MFNLKRIFRKNVNLDDSEMAYVEGRAADEESGRVRARLSKNTEEEWEVESLRDTVSLLRSVAPARAPRSFQLQEAPAPAGRRAPRLAMAPAALAVAAALFVGALTAGDLTGAVNQGGGANDPAAFTTASENEDSHEGSPEHDLFTEEQLRGTQIPDDALSTFSAGQADGTHTPEQAPPADSAGQTAEPAFTREQESADNPTPEVQATLTSGHPTASGAVTAAATPFALPFTDDGTWLSSGATSPESGERMRETGESWQSVSENSGWTLPVRELQAAGAGLAVAMAGLWAFLRRRATT
ncbi:MAG: hypothetical protein WD848_05375 [Dehalococcoidia bacterium]